MNIFHVNAMFLYTECLDMINQETHLESVLGDVQSDRLVEKEYSKNKPLQQGDQRNAKDEQKQSMQGEQRSERIQSFIDLICLVLAFGMDHIKNLNLKDKKVMICYYSGSEKLKGAPSKQELVYSVTGLLRKYWQGILCIGRVLGCMVQHIKMAMKLVHIWQKYVSFQFSCNILEWEAWSGGYTYCHPQTGSVGGLLNGPSLKLPSFNFLNNLKYLLFKIYSNHLL